MVSSIYQLCGGNSWFDQFTMKSEGSWQRIVYNDRCCTVFGCRAFYQLFGGNSWFDQFMVSLIYQLCGGNSWFDQFTTCALGILFYRWFHSIKQREIFFDCSTKEVNCADTVVLYGTTVDVATMHCNEGFHSGNSPDYSRKFFCKRYHYPT
jgi:hypothetical protein